MGYQEITDGLVRTLELEYPPVALAFVEEPPLGVAAFDGEVPSACSLWRQAEGGVFYAAAERHFNCLVGAMTMGFDLGAAERDQLMGLVGQMAGCGYLSPDEPERMPSVQQPKAGILYGPLSDFPTQPHLVLLWLSPRQAMLFGESVGSAAWTTPPARVYGRPGCAALPMAHNEQQVALSMGCMGMRTFTEIPDHLALAVLPGDRLEGLVDAVQATERSNQVMREYYAGHKAKFSA